MKRRVYFLAPDSRHAKRLVQELQGVMVQRQRIHCLAHDVQSLVDLPSATWPQRHDVQALVERLVRNTNLWIFFVALALCLTGVFMQWTWLLVIALGAMLLTLAFGLAVSAIPDAHISDFYEAVARGEVLVFCEIDKGRLLEIEQCIQHQHPQVILGGVGWCAGYRAL